MLPLYITSYITSPQRFASVISYCRYCVLRVHVCVCAKCMFNLVFRFERTITMLMIFYNRWSLRWRQWWWCCLYRHLSSMTAKLAYENCMKNAYQNAISKMKQRSAAAEMRVMIQLAAAVQRSSGDKPLDVKPTSWWLESDAEDRNKNVVLTSGDCWIHAANI